MRIKHLFADGDGRSRFGELDIPWSPTSQPDLLMTEIIPVKGIQIVKKARSHGLSGRSEYSPRLVFNLTGSARLGASTGETWVFGPGDILLSADAGSDGHSSEQIDDPRILLLAHLDAGVDIDSWRI